LIYLLAPTVPPSLPGVLWLILGGADILQFTGEEETFSEQFSRLPQAFTLLSKFVFKGRSWPQYCAHQAKSPLLNICALGYNEFDFFLENEEYRPFYGCRIEI
jgi:hypothetical protein